jgi:hypothetical protein
MFVGVDNILDLFEKKISMIYAYHKLYIQPWVFFFFEILKKMLGQLGIDVFAVLC